MVHEVAQILGMFAAALLIIAIVAWAKLLHRPRLQRLDERSAQRDDGVEAASQLLVVALCVSGAAALLAVLGVSRAEQHLSFQELVMVTHEEFRTLALSLPEVEERVHMGHPDFRVAGKVFATLDYPARGWGMVDLVPEQQADFMEIQPDGFGPAPGGWGANGSTLVRLSEVSETLISAAISAAWSKRAPPRLIDEL